MSAARRLVAVITIALAITIAASALAGSGTGILVGDTFVNSAPAAINNNVGGSHGIIIGTNGNNGTMHGLVRFDMPAGLAGRVTVTSAQVQLTLAGIGTPPRLGTPATYSLYRITQNWFEGTGAADAVGTFTVGVACAGAA